MTAKEHAERASKLLGIVESRLEAIAGLEEMQRLVLIADGRVKHVNKEVETSLLLARDHALTSLALQGLPVGALEATGDPEADAAAVRELTGGG